MAMTTVYCRCRQRSIEIPSDLTSYGIKCPACDMQAAGNTTVTPTPNSTIDPFEYLPFPTHFFPRID